MAFKTIEEANAYELQSKKEIEDLKKQLDNQKVIIDKHKEEENKYQDEIKRLKICNYELYEQVSQGTSNNIDTSEDNNTNNKKYDDITIDDILKEF